MISEVMEILRELARALNSLPPGFGAQAGDVLRDLMRFLATLMALSDQLLDLLEAIRWTSNVLLDLGLHFLYSACSGLLAWWGTRSLILWVLGLTTFRSRLTDSWQARLEPATWRFSLCSGLFVSWLAHCWWDGFFL